MKTFFFLVFTSSLAGVFVNLKPPLKISRSATDNLQFLGCTATKDFWALLACANTMIPRLAQLAPRTRRVKEVNRFFSKYAIIYPICSMVHTEKSALCYYVRFSQIRSHLTYTLVFSRSCPRLLQIMWFHSYYYNRGKVPWITPLLLESIGEVKLCQ